MKYYAHIEVEYEAEDDSQAEELAQEAAVSISRRAEVTAAWVNSTEPS